MMQEQISNMAPKEKVLAGIEAQNRTELKDKISGLLYRIDHKSKEDATNQLLALFDEEAKMKRQEIEANQQASEAKRALIKIIIESFIPTLGNMIKELDKIIKDMSPYERKIYARLFSGTEVQRLLFEGLDFEEEASQWARDTGWTEPS